MSDDFFKCAPIAATPVLLLLLSLAIGCSTQSTDNTSTDNTSTPPSATAPSARSALSAPSGAPTTANEPEVTDFRSWPEPQVALVFTGHQHGYIEPCGCTGLDKQKGGVARRLTFFNQLRDLGWDLVPVDTGDQVRRTGMQATIKLQQSMRALREMGYRAVGIGSDDLKLGVGELLAYTPGDEPDDPTLVSANVVLIDPTLTQQTKLIETNGRRIGLTSILDSARVDDTLSGEIIVRPIVDGARAAIRMLTDARADFRVLLFNGSEVNAKKLAREVRGFDLIVVSGDYGDALRTPETIEGSDTKMIVTGHKGMYASVIALYSRQPFKYAGIALSDEYADAPSMRQLMADYQKQLEDAGLSGLGLTTPVPHPSGQEFVGSAKCGECHTKAMKVWQESPHALATDHIVQPPKDRGDVARHFDPECISCHVTGWSPTEYFPYSSGYVSLQESAHLTGSGCENCHGPGSLHVAAETEGTESTEQQRDQFRAAMKLPLTAAEMQCKQCHDVDNSPDFHEPEAFAETYWPQVEHHGLD